MIQRSLLLIRPNGMSAPFLFNIIHLFLEKKKTLPLLLPTSDDMRNFFFYYNTLFKQHFISLTTRLLYNSIKFCVYLLWFSIIITLFGQIWHAYHDYYNYKQKYFFICAFFKSFEDGLCDFGCVLMSVWYNIWVNHECFMKKF